MSYSIEELARMENDFEIVPGKEREDQSGILFNKHGLYVYDVNVFNRNGKTIEHHCKLELGTTYPKLPNTDDDMHGCIDFLQSQSEASGRFIPSFALYNNLVQRLYIDGIDLKVNGSDKCIEKLMGLMPYTSFPFSPFTVCMTNTVIDYKTEEIVHYPHKDYWSDNWRLWFNGDMDQTILKFNRGEVQGFDLKKENPSFETGRFMCDLYGIDAPVSTLRSYMNLTGNNFKLNEPESKTKKGEGMERALFPIMRLNTHADDHGVSEYALSVDTSKDISWKAPWVKTYGKLEECPSCKGK